MSDAARKAAEEALAAWDGRFRPGAVGRTLIGYADAMAHALRALLAEPPEPAPAMPEGNHDAALRAENARLRDLLTSARYYVGHAGEMRDAIDAALATAAEGKEAER